MKNRTSALLTKFLNNQCTLEEEREVSQILEKPEGLSLLHQLMQELDDRAEDLPATDDDQIQTKMPDWQQRINHRIVSSTAQPTVKTATLQPKRNFGWIRFAAILLGLLLSSSILFWLINNRVFQQTEIVLVENKNPKHIPVVYTLPDQSKIFLAFGSKLRYPSKFTGNIREVSLEGDAFFEVFRNEAMPFIIRTGNITTKVLGTSFRIKMGPDRSVVVSVATGKVYVGEKDGNKENQLALLTKGQKVSWDAGTDHATEGTVDVNSLLQWKSGDLFFDEESLADITKELEHRYNVRVSIQDNAIGMKRVSGSFALGKDVEMIIRTLSVAGKFGFRSSEDKKEFIIYKKDNPTM